METFKTYKGMQLPAKNDLDVQVEAALGNEPNLGWGTDEFLNSYCA